MSLDAIFKAYDIRGVYPDEIDEAVARRIGNAFARVHRRAPPSSSATTCAPSSDRSGRRVHRGRDPRRRRRHRRRARARPTSSTSRRAARRARGDVHRQPQPGAVQRHQAVPGRRRAGRRADRPRPDQGDGRVGRASAGRGRRARSSSVDLLDEFAEHVRSFVDRSALRPLQVVADTANGMGGLVVPKVFEGLPFDLDGALRRARRHVPEPPGRPDPAREPRRTCSRRCSTPAPTSASRSTATPTASSSSTTRASRSAARPPPRSSPRGSSSSIPGETIVLQPHLLEGGARGHPRERRHAGAHAGRALVHQAGDGRDRRDLRRRALRALLLPRQLAGRLGLDRGAVRARAAVARGRAALGAAQAVRALRAERRDQHARRRPARGHRDGRGGVPRARAGPARRADRRLRRLVVQPAAEQHRAVAAAEPRSGRPSPRARRTPPKCSRSSASTEE